MQQDPNPGGEPGQTSPSHAGAQAMSPQDEQTWSVLAHLSVLLALVSLMPFGALLVWLIYKDRSEKVRFHALQALWYQIAWVVILVAYALISTVLTLLIIGFFMFFLLPVLAGGAHSPRLLRGVSGEPGGRLPLPVHSGQDRRTARGLVRRQRRYPGTESSMPCQHITFAGGPGTPGSWSRRWLPGRIGAG